MHPCIVPLQCHSSLAVPCPPSTRPLGRLRFHRHAAGSANGAAGISITPPPPRPPKPSRQRDEFCWGGDQRPLGPDSGIRRVFSVAEHFPSGIEASRARFQVPAGLSVAGQFLFKFDLNQTASGPESGRWGVETNALWGQIRGSGGSFL